MLGNKVWVLKLLFLVSDLHATWFMFCGITKVGEYWTCHKEILVSCSNHFINQAPSMVCLKHIAAMELNWLWSVEWDRAAHSTHAVSYRSAKRSASAHHQKNAEKFTVAQYLLQKRVLDDMHTKTRMYAPGTSRWYEEVAKLGFVLPGSGTTSFCREYSEPHPLL